MQNLQQIKLCAFLLKSDLRTFYSNREILLFLINETPLQLLTVTGLVLLFLTSYLSVSRPKVAANARLMSDKGYLLKSMAARSIPNCAKVSFFWRRLLLMSVS